MAKFKVGDRVSLRDANNEKRLSGVVIDADAGGEVRVEIDAAFDYGVPSVLRFPDEVKRIKPKPPKPKTIPARNLSGKHIGRVVSVVTREGWGITANLVEVTHDGDGVDVHFYGIETANMGAFHIDPDSEVIVNA